MLYIYIASLLFGGFFVGLSVVSGLGDSDLDLDKEFDLDSDLDFDGDMELDGDIDQGMDLDLELDHSADLDNQDLDIEVDRKGKRKKKYRPHFSFKFYTFIFAFFGLTGVVLTLLATGAIATFIAAAIMGILSGLGITSALHFADSSVAGEISANAYAGTSATVVLPIQKGELGKVKFRFKGQIVEMRAHPYDAEDEVVLDFGEPCFVINVKDGIAQVVHANQLEKHSK